MPASVPANHDDDDGGAPCRRAADARSWHRIGASSAARLRDGWRSDLQPGADTLHDAGRLLVPRSVQQAALWRRADTFAEHRPVRKFDISARLDRPRGDTMTKMDTIEN